MVSVDSLLSKYMHVHVDHMYFMWTKCVLWHNKSPSSSMNSYTCMWQSHGSLFHLKIDFIKLHVHVRVTEAML